MANTSNPVGNPRALPGEPKPDSEFRNFEEDARKLLKVPKRELDDKLREHEQRKDR